MIRTFLTFFLLASYPGYASTNTQVKAQEVILGQIVTPSNPPAGKNKLYTKNDNNLYFLTSAGVEAQIPAAGGGLPTTTKGDLVVHNGTTNVRQPVGTNGQVLTADSTQTTGVKWAATGDPAVNAQTANYTLLTTDGTVTFDATGAARTATLPTAVGASGKIYLIEKIDSSANTVTINTTSAQTVGGRASGNVVLRFKDDYVRVQSDGANWIILAKKETQFIQTSWQVNANQSAADTYYTTGTSVTLTPGHWRLYGQFYSVTNTTGSGAFLRAVSGFYAADGGNSASVPTALSGLVIGYTNFDGNLVASGDIFNGGGNNTTTAALIVETSVASNTNVYLVPKTYFTTAGNSFYRGLITAIRVW